MKDKLPLPDNKKLMVTYRIEAGCLGPTGTEHIDRFCQFAELGVTNLDSDFVHWHITPRNNKKQSESSYSVDGKQLTHDKADKYLHVFNKNLDDFEDHLQEKLHVLIDCYMQR